MYNNDEEYGRLFFTISKYSKQLTHILNHLFWVTEFNRGTKEALECRQESGNRLPPGSPGSNSM